MTKKKPEKKPTGKRRNTTQSPQDIQRKQPKSQQMTGTIACALEV